MKDTTVQIAVKPTKKSDCTEVYTILDQINRNLPFSNSYDLNPYLFLKLAAEFDLSTPFLGIVLKSVLSKMQVFKQTINKKTGHDIDPLYSLYMQLQLFTNAQSISLQELVHWLFDRYQHNLVTLTKNMAKILNSPFLGPDTHTDQIGASMGLTYQASATALRSLREKGILQYNGMINPRPFYLTPVFLLLPSSQHIQSKYIVNGTRFSGGQGLTCYYFLYPTSQYPILVDKLENNLGSWQLYGTGIRLKDTMSFYFFNQKHKRFMLTRKNFGLLNHASTGSRTLIQRPPENTNTLTKRLMIDAYLAYYLEHDLKISNTVLARLLKKTPGYISERKTHLLKEKIIYPHLSFDRLGLEETVLLLSKDYEKAKLLSFLNYLPRSQSFKIIQRKKDPLFFASFIRGPNGIGSQIAHFLDFHEQLQDYSLFHSLSMINQNLLFPQFFIEKSQSWQIDNLTVT